MADDGINRWAITDGQLDTARMASLVGNPIVSELVPFIIVKI